MAADAIFDDGRTRNRTWLWVVLGLLALAAAGYGIWSLTNQTLGKAKKAPPSTTALLLPPPPPPPLPPPQEKPPEPTEVIKPVPTEVPTPVPEKTPEADAAPAAVSIDAAPTGAGDSFGLQGGGPGGMGGAGATGTGRGPAGGGVFSDGIYGRNLSSALQQRIQDEDAVNRQVFSAEFSVWVDARGRVTRAELVRSSGNAKRDEKLVAVLQSVADLDAPPASIRFPARVTVRGRRSSI